MARDFEDHCWRDVIPPALLEVYAHYKRDVYVGPRPALLAIDLYELVYQGGPLPIEEVTKTYPSSCGVHAFEAIPPTTRIFEAARSAGLPVIYTTSDVRVDSKPRSVSATNRSGVPLNPELYDIRADFKPHPGDTVITKQRASAFFGTPLIAHLTQLGVQSLIVVGDSTSGCVRASVVDGYSHGFHMTVVEECCFDRSEISHKVNLFDLHHKYADVMVADEVIEALAKMPSGQSAAAE